MLWRPTASSASTKTYNLQSNGLFEVLAGNVVVFRWNNNMSQDFSINKIYTYNFENPDMPGSVVSDGIYRQIATWKKSSGPLQTWVESYGTEIENLSLTCSNGTASFLSKSESLGNNIIRSALDLSEATVGSPCEVKLGNVLVLYIESVTE